jgi:DNA polymerase-3 subunit epsilon
MKEFLLCPKLCFMQTSTDVCTGIAEEHCNGACEKKESASLYNERVLEAIASLTKRPSYVVLDEGLTEDEVSCIMVVQGNFFGMGYLPKNFDTISQKAIADYITPYKDNSTIRMLLSSFASANPERIKML